MTGRSKEKIDARQNQILSVGKRKRIGRQKSDREEPARHRAHGVLVLLHAVVTQAGYRDWIKIPVLTNRLLPDLTPHVRLHVFDAAHRQVPKDSWRWELWVG